MSSPVGWTDAVVVADTRGIAVTPLDASQSGRAVELPGSAPRTPALRGDAIFTTRAETGGEPVVVRLDSSGTEEWQRTLPGAEITAPVVADGRLFLGTDERHLALDAETGKRVWAVGDGLSTRDWDQQLTENLAPAVAADTVVFPTGDGVLAVDTSSGSIAWRLNGDQVRSAPVVRDGRVYVPDFGFGIRVLDLHTGDAVWQFPADGTWATPVVTDSRVYAGTTRGVVALRRGSIDTDSAEPVEQTADTAATERTRVHAAQRVTSTVETAAVTVPPAGFVKLDDTLLVGTTDTSVTAVSLAGDLGEQLWLTGQGSYAAPAVVGDRLVFLDHDHTGLSLVVSAPHTQ